MSFPAAVWLRANLIYEMRNQHALYSIRLPYLDSIGLPATRRWLAAAWQALPHSRWRRLLPDQRHLSLELIGTPIGIQYILAIPSPILLQSITDQLSAHFPGTTCEPTSGYLRDHCPTATVELGAARFYDQPFLVPKSSEVDIDPLAGILASFQGMDQGELAAIQILVRPAVVSDVESPSFEIVLRLLAQSASEISARSRVLRLMSAFGPFAAANRLRPLRSLSASRFRLREFRRRSWPWIRWHIPILSVDELATIYHFPSHRDAQAMGISVATLPYFPLRQPPPTEGLMLGHARFRGATAEVRVHQRDLLRHTIALAATGGGKSTLLANLALELARQGAGFTLMDPHGELVRSLVESLPDQRLSDTVLLRFADPDYPVGLNVLRAGDGDGLLVAEELVEVFRRLYAQSYWGPLLDTVLRHAAIAVIEAGGTLVDMARLLDDDLFRASLLERVRNPETLRFWESFGQLPGGSQERRAASTATRLQRFLANPLMRNIVGQANTRFDPRDALDRGQITLVDLSGIGIGNAKLLGSMLTVMYYQAALAREAVAPQHRRPHILIMDESSWFISSTIADMSDQVRKYGLGLVLAAQRLSQIKPDEVRDAIFANFANLICFGLGEHGEAAYVARHLNTHGLGPEEIRRLPPFHAYAQLLFDGQRSAAFCLEGAAPPQAIQDGGRRWDQLLAVSRERYAQPRDLVEAQMAEQERRLRGVERFPEVRVLDGELLPFIADAAHATR